MSCFYPVTAYRLENGQVSFNEKGKIKQTLTLPCGGCIGCRLEKSRQWAVRCIHEAQMHKKNCFITLTYNEENHAHSLVYQHFQRFMRRYRKEFPNHKIRFYMAGEYGDQNGRPHFHACIFGHDFDDKVPFQKLPSGSIIYTSKTLERLWPFGYSSTGELTFESAAYVARYILKKQTGKNADEHYQSCDARTGELRPITPEFNRMSLKPGIGATWFDRYKNDIYPTGTLIINGQKTKPPRYYEKRYSKGSTKQAIILEGIQHDRLEKLKPEDQTAERLADREKVVKAKLTHKKRGLSK